MVKAVAHLQAEEASGRPGPRRCALPGSPCTQQPTRRSAEASPGAGCACVALCPGDGCSRREIPKYLPAGRCQVVQELCGSGCACVTLYRTGGAALFVGEG